MQPLYINLHARSGQAPAMAYNSPQIHETALPHSLHPQIVITLFSNRDISISIIDITRIRPLKLSFMLPKCKQLP